MAPHGDGNMTNLSAHILAGLSQAELPPDDAPRGEEHEEARGQLRILALVPAAAALAMAIYFLVQ